MSYNRSYHQRVAIHYSGSVSYPASQNGGSIPYSGTEYEDVYVNIDVDTIPFDNSVADCNLSVNTLTGAVVATEAAQIASIDKNSRKVANTIIQGFFKNIRFEISAQVMELKQKIDAHLMHLHELSKQLIAKKAQMETDYNRTANRYGKVFNDLNNELSNRIFELDKPAFSFKRLADAHSQRTNSNDMVSTITVTGSEGGDLQTRISSSITKKHAHEAINQANIFLTKQRKTQQTINQSMLNDVVVGQKLSPICFMEVQDENNQLGKSLYQADYLPKIKMGGITESFQDNQWLLMPKEKQEKIGLYFNSSLNTFYFSDSQHSDRVKDTIIKIFDLNSIKCI